MSSDTSFALGCTLSSFSTIIKVSAWNWRCLIKDAGRLDFKIETSVKFKYISNAEIQGVRKSWCLTQYSLLVILNSEGLVERPMGQDSTWHMSKFVGFSRMELRLALQSPDLHCKSSTVRWLSSYYHWPWNFPDPHLFKAFFSHNTCTHCAKIQYFFQKLNEVRAKRGPSLIQVVKCNESDLRS